MNLTKKQILIVLLTIISLIIIILYYIFFSSNNNSLENFDISNSNDIITNTEINIETNSLENTTISTTPEIVIHITGAVNSPGIIHLQEGSRITDAIEKAGGTTTSADLNKINLAYILQDAQKIYIPNTSDKQNVEYIISDSFDIQSTNSNTNTSKSDNNNSQKNTLLNINTATQEQLESLPGIGPSTAIKIIDHRTLNGKFKSIEDIMNVKGIGDSKYESLKDYICVK